MQLLKNLWRRSAAAFIAVAFLLNLMCPVFAAQTTLPANGYLSNTGRTNAQMQQAMEDIDSVIMELVGGTAEKAATALSSDTLTPVVDYAVYPITPETGTADNLSTISTTSARDGSVLVVRNSNSTNTISVLDSVGNIKTADGLTISLNATGDYVAFILRSSTWYELFRTEGSRIKTLVGGNAEAQVTIAAGMLPITQATTKIEGEGNVSDNLDGISSTVYGNIAIIRATNASHVITVRNNQSVTAGYYKILTLDGASVVMDSLTKYMILHKDVSGTAWREVVRGGFDPVFVTSQTANTVLCGPASGAAAVPTFRAPVLADLPTGGLYLQQAVRMYTTTNQPESVGNSSGNLYIGPYHGNVVHLPNDSTGNTFTPISFSQLTYALGSDNFRLYDGFLYINSGAVAFEATAWDSGGQTTGTITGATAANPCVLTTSNSLSNGDYIGIRGITGTMGSNTFNGLNDKVFRVAVATATTLTLETNVSTSGLTYTSGGTWYKVPASRTNSLTFQNGVYLKTADKTRLYIGTFGNGFRAGAGVIGNTNGNYMVSNFFNRIPSTSLYTVLGTAGTTHAYTTNTFRPYGLGLSDRIEAVRVPNASSSQQGIWPVDLPFNAKSSSAGGQFDLTVASGGGSADMGTYGTPTTGPIVSGNTQVANSTFFVAGRSWLNLRDGYIFGTFYERANGGTTMTWTDGWQAIVNLDW